MGKGEVGLKNYELKIMNYELFLFGLEGKGG
jgi:hypothetical protein